MPRGVELGRTPASSSPDVRASVRSDPEDDGGGRGPQRSRTQRDPGSKAVSPVPQPRPGTARRGGLLPRGAEEQGLAWDGGEDLGGRGPGRRDPGPGLKGPGERWGCPAGQGGVRRGDLGLLVARVEPWNRDDSSGYGDLAVS